MPPTNFDPEKDLHDLTGKVVFITGGTSGLGTESVLALARKNPAAIYFSGRNARSASAVIEKVHAAVPTAQVHFLECDLASLPTVATAARTFLSRSPRLDILMCNAGIMCAPPGLTSDGYELHFGTNHLGHALLIKLLLPLLLQTSQQPNADVRIVLLSSLGAGFHPPGGIVFDGLKTPQSFGWLFGSFTRYGQSKLANLLYARELARRFPGVRTLAVHPGVASTGLVTGDVSWKDTLIIYALSWWVMVPPEQGAWNQLWAAAGEGEEVVNGGMYEPVGVLSERGGEAAGDEGLAGRLWEWTERELEGY